MPPATQKNVLLIIIDQLRADCLTGALAEHVEMPNLTALKDSAVTFDRNFSVANPCGPSRASILTGQYAMNHGSIRNRTPLRHDIPTLASEMGRLGFDPLLFGYTDTSRDPRFYASDHPAMQTYEYPMAGFREVVEMRQGFSDPWMEHLRMRGYTPEMLEDLYAPVTPYGGEPKPNDPAIYSAEDSDTAFLTDAFLDRMQGIEPGWFSTLTYIRPHPPLVAPAPYNKMYDPNDLPMPARLAMTSDEAAIHPFFDPAMRYATTTSIVDGIEYLEPSDENVQALRAVYLGLATEVDHHIGRVLKFLESSGLAENTMVVICADHGEMLGDRHSWGKMSVYGAAFHTPLMIRIPGAGASGRAVRHPTESVDIAPTILDWVGGDIPNSMDGTSLLPILNGQNLEGWRDCTFSEIDLAQPDKSTLWETELGLGKSEAGVAILREEKFTLVEFAADLDPMLFDHSAEGEFQNVANQPEYGAELARLTRKMLRHRMKNRDHTLTLDAITSDGPVQSKRWRPT